MQVRSPQGEHVAVAHVLILRIYPDVAEPICARAQQCSRRSDISGQAKRSNLKRVIAPSRRERCPEIRNCSIRLRAVRGVDAKRTLKTALERPVTAAFKVPHVVDEHV